MKFCCFTLSCSSINSALRAGDAVYLASVLRVKQATAHEVVFVASDKELVEASRAAGFAVLNPEKEDALVTLANLREPDSDSEKWECSGKLSILPFC